MRHANWTAAIIGVLLASCTVGPDYVPPQVDVPDHWTGQPPTAPGTFAATDQIWWQGFHDPVLDHLLDLAAQANLDLQIARQHLLQARALRDVTAAQSRPQVMAGASDILQRTSPTVMWPPGIGESKTYQAGLDASWEIDVFGGTRRAVEAADAITHMAVEDSHAIQVSLMAEVAADYVTLRTSQARQAIAGRNIASQQQTLALTQHAYRAGVGREVDVIRARAAVEMSQSQLPALKAAEERMIHAIGVLTGNFPNGLLDELGQAGRAVPTPPPLPETLPSDVVRNRPDIRRAERRIAAATANVGVATAELFPHFAIPLGIGAMASNIENMVLAHSMVWTLGASAGQMIYDGDRSESRIRAAQAVAESDRIAYRQTILTAFREVEDAASNLAAERQRFAALQSAALDERKALDQTTRLYAQGLTDFLKVLDSQRTVFQVEDTLLQSQQTTALEIIAVYKATGGGWTP